MYAIDDLERIAERIARSRIYDGLTTDRAFVLLLIGQALGFDPVAALDVLILDRGRPSLTPRGQLALIQRAGALDEFTLERLADDDGAFAGYRCRMRRGVVAFEAAFTLRDAERAGLIANPSWQSYPENMCRWRAIGMVADVVCPDLALGGGRPLSTTTTDPLDLAIRTYGADRVAQAFARTETPDEALDLLERGEMPDAGLATTVPDGL